MRNLLSAFAVTFLIGSISPLTASAKIEEPDVALDSPRNLQVVQRMNKAIGRVTVSGKLRAVADSVEARVTGKDATGADVQNNWRPVAFDKGTHGFFAQLELPAGGWYTLEVHGKKGETAVCEASVAKFGVGEVFVIAGQSNSTNSGQEKTTQTSGMVSAFSGRDWVVADDPMPGCHDHSGGGSPWPAFGDAMFAKYKVPIGIASTGHGGTSVNQWQPDGELFNWSLARIDQLGTKGFRALLWHQGESDVGMTADEYATKMTATILASKKSAGWDFPWFVAQVSYHNPQQPKFDSTRNAHKMLWDAGIAMEGPDTDTLGEEFRDNAGKGIHFSPKGLKAHGQMWAEKVGVYLDKQLETSEK